MSIAISVLPAEEVRRQLTVPVLDYEDILSKVTESQSVIINLESEIQCREVFARIMEHLREDEKWKGVPISIRRDTSNKIFIWMRK